MNLPAKYTETELEKARRSGKVVGWVQGAGVVLGGAIVWNLLGWIPTLAVIGGVVWVLYKLLGGGSDDSTS